MYATAGARQSLHGYSVRDSPTVSSCTGREALAALSGYTDLSSLRRDAALIYGLTVRDERVTIFPDIVFTCSGQITNFTFVAAVDNMGVSRNPQLEVWRAVNDTMTYQRVSAVAFDTTDITQISNDIYSISPANINFEEGDSIGLHQPRSDETRIDIMFQDGGSYGTIYQTSNNPISELSLESTTNDYLLAEVTTGLFMV